MNKEADELIESMGRHLEAFKTIELRSDEGASRKAVKQALRTIDTYAAYDKPEQLKWLINQIVEVLTITPEAYDVWVRSYERVDEDGDPIYMWEKGSL